MQEDETTTIPTRQSIEQPPAQIGEPISGGASQPLPPVGPTQTSPVQTLPDEPGIVFPSGVLLESCDPTDPDGDKCKPGLVCASDPSSSKASAGKITCERLR